MSYDFSRVIERRGTNCLKFDSALQRKGREDLLPLWVADMDIALPEEVLAPIREAVDHGIFGYSIVGECYKNAVISWYKNRFGWDIDPEWMVQTTGVVFSIGVAIQTYTDAGDAILIQEPVYHPFAHLIKSNKRTLVNNELVYDQGVYSIDFEDFERQIVDNDVKMFILCSPHNPVGRVWTREELLRMGEICVAHDVLIVADEIHADFTYPGHTHEVFVTLSDEFLARTITCTAPSKTFNIAGLQSANTVIADEGLRVRYTDALDRMGFGGLSSIALAATQSVYENGAPWLDALKVHLQGNLDYFRSYLEQHIPQARLVEPEGTYLTWVDFSGLGFADDELDPFIIEKAHLWLNSGSMFGASSAQFERFNIACPKATLVQALEQLHAALEQRG